MNKGYIVPRKTIKRIVNNSQLLTSIPDSLLIAPNELGFSNVAPFEAKRLNEKSRTIAKNNRINKPLPGSEAKVWTEFKIPDLTKNVPTKLNEKVKIESNIVHDWRVSFFSNTIIQCNRAVAESHGINDAFSTGSQNQKPPHPNS